MFRGTTVPRSRAVSIAIPSIEDTYGKIVKWVIRQTEAVGECSIEGIIDNVSAAG
jgi:hypothetical protein